MLINLIFFLCINIFILRTIVFFIGAYKQRHKKHYLLNYESLPYVSVIIPARNEEENIKKCIESIAKSDYPTDKYEIIAINDRSRDNTYSILNELEGKIENLKIINITKKDAEDNLTGKAGALQKGIDNAKGDIILMTDADCIIHNKWIRSVVSYYSDKDVALVASFTYIHPKNYFEILQSLEWIYMHSAASAGIGLKQPLGCFGNNLSIRKSVFEEIGGYRNIRFSVTEDLALIQAVAKQKKKIIYKPEETMTVFTLPVKTIKEYLAQHHRWAVGGIDLGWRAIFFVLSSIAIWIAVILSILSHSWLMLIGTIITRMIGDFIIIFPSLLAIKKSKHFLYIFPSVIFFMLIELILPFLLLNKNVIWKEQVFKRD